jgi:rubrerythrin
MSKLKGITCLLGAIIGIIIVFIGIHVQGISIDRSHTTIGENIKFGTDFYTEMYEVTQDVGQSINSLKSTVANAAESVCDAIGYLIMSLGLTVSCFFGYKIVIYSNILENMVSIKSTTSMINKNVQIIAQPMIDETEEKKREAEAIAKREAEEKAKCEAEAKAKREAEIKAKREAAAKAKENSKNWIDTTPFFTTEKGTIICSQCNTEQQGNRKVCWNCSAKFE